MASLSDVSAIKSRFPGYRSWNDLQSIVNDFNATGGQGKGPDGSSGGGGGGGGGGGLPQVSAADMVKLRQQAYDATSSYYQKLAEEAQGDFNKAIEIMTSDYKQGVRQAKEKYAYEQKYGKGALDNALESLGVSFGKENESLVDSLNKRGMATYQNNPNGTPNVVTTEGFDPQTNTEDFSFSSNLTQPNQTANLGRGGFEVGRLQKEQGLRAEAEMRARMQPLEQSTMNLKNFTNPNAGFDPSKPGQSTQGIDRSTLGQAESNLYQQNYNQSKTLRETLQGQANQRSQDINSIAGNAANIGQNSLSQDMINQIQKERTTGFVQGGNS